MTASKSKKIHASEFDEAFEQGEVLGHLDINSVKARYPTQRISIDFPKKVIEGIDLEAAKIGVTRTSLIKIWVAEHLTKD
ncbi:MAG: CopG family transcriptional regulator [Legionella sp.]|nr:CopG family transcriptional regulator [Legionella sp.]